MVDGDAEWCADCILTAVALADRVFFFVVCGKVELQFVDNFAGFFRQAVLADQWHYGAFHGSQCGGKVEYYAGIAAFESLFFVGRAEYAKEHAVDAD